MIKQAAAIVALGSRRGTNVRDEGIFADLHSKYERIGYGQYSVDQTMNNVWHRNGSPINLAT